MDRGDKDGTVERFSVLANEILGGPARLGAVRFVAVDGPAGSGKTTFARRLAGALRTGSANVAEVHVDDLLEGWTGLATYWPRLCEQILEPLRQGLAVDYQRYDWVRCGFAEERVALGRPDVLVLEGVGSARAAGDAWRSLAVYVQADRELRLARGIERDGGAMRPDWLRWMADEDSHFAAEGTPSRAQVLINGAPTTPHDPEREFVRLTATPQATPS